MNATKKPIPSPLKRLRESNNTLSPESLPDVAFAAIASSKKQAEVNDFLNYLLAALQRNCDWLNTVVSKQTGFKCALMTGAGPNRFQIQEMIYPADENQVKLEIEIRENDDHDKIAIAALLKMKNQDQVHVIDFIKNRLHENKILKDDVLKGKAMGIQFAVLKPLSEKMYRVMERITIGSCTKCALPKKRREDKLFGRPPVKKARKVV